MLKDGRIMVSFSVFWYVVNRFKENSTNCYSFPNIELFRNLTTEFFR